MVLILYLRNLYLKSSLKRFFPLFFPSVSLKSNFYVHQVKLRSKLYPFDQITTDHSNLKKLPGWDVPYPISLKFCLAYLTSFSLTVLINSERSDKIKILSLQGHTLREGGPMKPHSLSPPEGPAWGQQLPSLMGM